MQADPYSRLISLLKVILPLVALAILSTLFLFSRSMEPGNSIPFADAELAERIRGQQVTNPLFSGMTARGDRIAFTAADIAMNDDSNNVARKPLARLDFVAGGNLTVIANHGVLNLPEDNADLSGDVLLHSSTGYVIRSQEMTARLSIIDVVFPTEVTADGPAGHLTAGALHILADEDDKNTQLLFTKGVKLIYDRNTQTIRPVDQ